MTAFATIESESKQLLGYFVLPATVFFNETSCMIGINHVGIENPLTFDEEGRLIAAEGYAFEWPDDETGRQVLEMFRREPRRVFVCEFGPDGPVAEHDIV